MLSATLAGITALIACCQVTGKPGGSGSITTAEATSASQTIVGAVSIVLNNQARWTTNGTNVSYDASGISMSGTSTTSGSANTESLNITLTNYQDSATGYTVSGIGSMSTTTNTSTGSVIAGSIAAAFTATGGAVTTEHWDISNVTSTGGTTPVFTFTGSVRCNDSSFDANTLSLGDSLLAANAAAAVIGGVNAVLDNQTSWTISGSNVSYSQSGASMTGTTATSGSNTIYTLSITLSSFADSTRTIYTVNGTVGVTLTEVTSGSAFVSGTISGTLSLSGGQVTTQTWNTVSMTGSNPQTFTGTISSDGTLYDAKTLH